MNYNVIEVYTLRWTLICEAGIIVYFSDKPDILYATKVFEFFRDIDDETFTMKSWV